MFAFEVDEQLDAFWNFAMVPVLVLLQGHEVAFVDEPIGGIFGMLAQSHVGATFRDPA